VFADEPEMVDDAQESDRVRDAWKSAMTLHAPSEHMDLNVLQCLQLIRAASRVVDFVDSMSAILIAILQRLVQEHIAMTEAEAHGGVSSAAGQMRRSGAGDDGHGAGAGGHGSSPGHGGPAAVDGRGDMSSSKKVLARVLSGCRDVASASLRCLLWCWRGHEPARKSWLSWPSSA
jgi:hypothetical protein